LIVGWQAESEQMSSEANGHDAPSPSSSVMSAATAATCFLAVVAVVFFYASVFLQYLTPVLSRCLIYAAVPIFLVMFILLLVALFRRRWRTVAIFALAGILVSPPYVGVYGPTTWLHRQGFRMHVALAGNYLSRCRLFDFVEDGIKQSFGACESSWLGPIESTVFYDTAGQLTWPASRRTPGWKEAMSHFSPQEVLADLDDRADHLVGDFYLVDVNMDEMK
jgi:hypothetical protein